MDHINKLDFELNKELSSEDFQEKLYQWLEEQGILPGLRTYLRHQLISALKHTHLSSEYLNRKKNHLSPKTHAFNLLVAEYLLEQNYHYTVSIFYSEEPHLGRLPTHIKLPPEGKASMKYFKEKDVEDILESLNFGHSPKFVKKVVDMYFGGQKGLASTSLLKAIFQAFVDRYESPRCIKPELAAGDAYTSEDKETTLIKHSSEMTNKTAVGKTNQVSQQSQDNYYQHKNSLVQQEGKLNDLERKQREFERRVQDEVKKLHEEQEHKMAVRRKNLEEELMAKQQNLLEVMNLLRDQQAQLQQHFEEIQKKEDLLNQKETKLEENQRRESVRLIEKHNEISKAQQKLEEDLKRLNQEKNTVKFLQKEMEVGHQQILEVAQLLGNSQLELGLLQSLHFDRETKNERSEIHQSHQDAKHNFSDPFNVVQSMRTLQEHAIHACQRTIGQLKDKNNKLQLIANEQQSKINALSSTASTLNSQLEEATAALRFLSSQDERKSNLHLLDGSQQQHITFPVTRLEGTAQLATDGQSEVFAKDKMHKNKHLEKRAQKQYLKDNIPSSYKQESDESVCSVASSPTDEILREARHRLQRLEIESDEVDRRYYKFKQKHLAKGIGISALHFSHAIPVDSQPQEREKSLPNHAVGLTSLASPYESHLHPQQQSNISIQFENGFGQHRLLHREEPEPFINKLTVHTQTSNKNPSHITRHVSPNFSSTSHKFQQDVDVAVGNNKINTRVIIPQNSGQMASVEDNQNTFKLNRSSLSAPQTQFGDKQLETRPSHNVRSVKQLPPPSDFSREEIQNDIHPELSQNKDVRYLHSAEKNHLTALNVDTSLNNQGHPPENEKADKTNFKNKNGVASLQPVVHLLNNKESDKNTYNSPSELVADQQVLQEEELEAQASVSSSSPKLSVGVNDSKAAEDSDFW